MLLMSSQGMMDRLETFYNIQSIQVPFIQSRHLTGEASWYIMVAWSHYSFVCWTTIPVYHCVYGWGNCQNSFVCWTNIPVYHCVYGWGNCQNSLVCCAIIPVYHLSLALVYGYGNCQNSFMCCTIIPVYHLSPGVWLRELSEQFSVLYNHTSLPSVPWCVVEGIVGTV